MRRRLIMLAYVAGAAFFLAHMLNAWVSQALTTPTVPVLVGADIASPAPQSAQSDKLIDVILSSRVFALPDASESWATRDREHPRDRKVEALHLDRSLRLIGTVLGDGWSAMAVLEDRRTKKQTLFRLHQEIPGIGQLVGIQKNAIVVEADGVRDELVLSDRMPTSVDERVPMAGAGVGQISGTAPVTTASWNPVVSLSPVHRIVDRRMLAEGTESLPRLLSQARAVPYYINGKIEGWRVVSMQPGSLFVKLGLQKGDILQRVNGMPIRDPAAVLTLFQQVKNEDQVNLDLVRQNQRLAMTYEIR